jgi:Reverse transcriptase (RNA-dependent DNA polymerase)
MGLNEVIFSESLRDSVNIKKRSKYKYFTKLDISMQYYTFELDEESKELCCICTPFGNYKYNRLTMGIKQSPDVAQQIMEELLRPFEEVDVYIDDIGIFSNSWEEHIQSLHKILKILQDNNFTVNPLKCEWAVQETDWLGYWLTPTGIKPWKKKIDAILALNRPTSIHELRSFIGAVTFYRDMFPRRSHLLAPLTAQFGQRNLRWTPKSIPSDKATSTNPKGLPLCEFEVEANCCKALAQFHKQDQQQYHFWQLDYHCAFPFLPTIVAQ